MAAASIQQSVASLEYVRANISEIVSGIAQDPTGDTVAWLFLPSGQNPVGGESYSAGSWDTAKPPFVARCLVGPSGTKQLTTGSYSMFVKITDNPEVPVIKHPSTLVIF